jgi:ribosome-associated protein
MKRTLDDSLRLALACRDAADDKKAEDPVLLDVRGLSTFTDYLLICSAASEPQLKAIANSITEHAREKLGRSPLGREGAPASQWVVVDFGDVTVHVFHAARRSFYRLEELWNDAPRVK